MSNMFVCTKCGNVDSIFTTRQETEGGLECKRCKDGDWHDMFEERKYDTNEDNPFNFINPPQTA